MSFVKENIKISGINFNEPYIKNNNKKYLDKYQNIIENANIKAEKILLNAEENAQNIINQAKSKAEDLIIEAENNVQEMLDNAQNLINQEKLEFDNEKQNLEINVTNEAQQAVFNAANDLLEALQIAQLQFTQISEPFIKKIIKTIIEKFTTEIDLKDKLYILATQVLEKSRQLENGIWYFHPDNIDKIPKLNLPPSWKISQDATLAIDECKLSASGSEWKISFDNISNLILEWFDESKI